MSRSSYSAGFPGVKTSLNALKAKTLPRPDPRKFEGRHPSADDARVRDIAARWAHVREQFEKNRKNRVEALDEYLNDFDKRVAEVVADTYVNVPTAHQKQKKIIQDLQEIVAEVQAEIERLEDRQQKACGLIEETCRDMVADMKAVASPQQTQARWEEEISGQIEDKFLALSSAFLKAKKGHADRLDSEASEINSDLLDLKEAIADERAQREEGSEHTVATVQVQLERLEEEILIEQKVREETSDKLRTLIQEMEAKLDRDIEVGPPHQVEAKDREATNTSLLALLEEACSRIERTFNSDL